MVKAQLTFELPEDKAELELASKARNLLMAIQEFDDQVLRKMVKYNSHPTEERELTDDENLLANDIRSKLWEIMNEHKVGDLE